MPWRNANFGQLLIRIGVALAFLYPPFDGLSNPDSWIGYFPSFVSAIPLEAHLMLHIFEIIEVIIGLWILSGWKIRIPAIVAAVILLAIVVFNGAQFPILFRDVSIALAALALAFIPRVPKTNA